VLHEPHRTLGFNPQPLIAGVVIVPATRYPKEQQIVAFYDQLLERVEHLPNVTSAGTTLSLPPNLLNLTNPFWVPGMPATPGTNQPMAVETTVSPGYFRTLGVSLLRGRLFDDSDRGRKDGILIINETMARRYFRDRDPVGQKIKTRASVHIERRERLVHVLPIVVIGIRQIALLAKRNPF
jgi:hypothetical protein